MGQHRKKRKIPDKGEPRPAKMMKNSNVEKGRKITTRKSQLTTHSYALRSNSSDDRTLQNEQKPKTLGRMRLPPMQKQKLARPNPGNPVTKKRMKSAVTREQYSLRSDQSLNGGHERIVGAAIHSIKPSRYTKSSVIKKRVQSEKQSNKGETSSMSSVSVMMSGSQDQFTGKTGDNVLTNKVTSSELERKTGIPGPSGKKATLTPARIQGSGNLSKDALPYNSAFVSVMMCDESSNRTVSSAPNQGKTRRQPTSTPRANKTSNTTPNSQCSATPDTSTSFPVPSTSSDVNSPQRKARQTNPVPGLDQVPPAFDYSYKKLADLPKHFQDLTSMPQKTNDKVNVYGVVEFFKAPMKTLGIDHIMVVVLRDESLQADGFRCSLFAKTPESLPEVTSVGDILRLHRIKLVKYGNTVRGQSSPGWSGLVFPKNGSQPISTSENFTLTNKDHRKVERLRRLTPVGNSPMTPAIENIRHGTYVDITCQVVATRIQNDRAVLRVWDGTKLPSECQTYGVNLDNTSQDIQDISNGLTVDVLVFDDHAREAETLQPGDMVKLVNVLADHGRKNPNDFGLVMRGGKSYGRGINILDRESCDYQILENRINRSKNSNARSSVND